MITDPEADDLEGMLDLLADHDESLEAYRQAQGGDAYSEMHDVATQVLESSVRLLRARIEELHPDIDLEGYLEEQRRSR